MRHKQNVNLKGQKLKNILFRALFDYGKHNQSQLTSLLLDVISFIKNVGNCYSIIMRHKHNLLLKVENLKIFH